MVELLKKAALNRFSKQRAESHRWVPVQRKGWGCGRCGEVQRGFPVILVPSTGPSPQEGLWQRGLEHGWPGWGGRCPPGAGAVFPPCRAHGHSWCCTPQ